jgi:hypothetical protein
MIKGALDPNIPFGIREKLLPIVTAVLQEMIKVYPIISFHMPSQRLAVGCSYDANLTMDDPEMLLQPRVTHACGQVIIWDLKTATRTQICEAHGPNNITALGFNRPDPISKNKELLMVTYSMDEEVVKVWKPHGNFFAALASLGQGEGLGLSQGGALTMFRSFKVDKMAVSPDDVTVDQKKNKKKHRGGVMEVARFEWKNERTVLLHRAEPYASLTFTV